MGTEENILYALRIYAMFLLAFGALLFLYNQRTPKKIKIVEEPTPKNFFSCKDWALLQYLTNEPYFTKKYIALLDGIKKRESVEHLAEVHIPFFGKVFFFTIYLVVSVFFILMFYRFFGENNTIVFVLGILLFLFAMRVASNVKEQEYNRKKRIIMGVADVQDFKTVDDFNSYIKFAQMLSFGNLIEGEDND